MNQTFQIQFSFFCSTRSNLIHLNLLSSPRKIIKIIANKKSVLQTQNDSIFGIYCILYLLSMIYSYSDHNRKKMKGNTMWLTYREESVIRVRLFKCVSYAGDCRLVESKLAKSAGSRSRMSSSCVHGVCLWGER